MFKSDTVLVASRCVEVCLFTGHKKEEKRQTTDNSRLGDKKSLTVCCRLLVRRTEFSLLVLHKHERLWKAACWYAVAPCDPPHSPTTTTPSKQLLKTSSRALTSQTLPLWLPSKIYNTVSSPTQDAYMHVFSPRCLVSQQSFCQVCIHKLVK